MEKNTKQIRDHIERIWLFSKYYSDLLRSSFRLYDFNEWYAACLVLFNATELIIKASLGDYGNNFNQDIKSLKNLRIITDEEYDFFENSDFGIRKIRNIMTHRDAYEYALTDSYGINYMLSEDDTWKIIFEKNAPKIVEILDNVVQNSFCPTNTEEIGPA